MSKLDTWGTKGHSNLDLEEVEDLVSQNDVNELIVGC